MIIILGVTELVLNAANRMKDKATTETEDGEEHVMESQERFEERKTVSEINETKENEEAVVFVEPLQICQPKTKHEIMIKKQVEESDIVNAIPAETNTKKATFSLSLKTPTEKRVEEEKERNNNVWLSAVSNSQCRVPETDTQPGAWSQKKDRLHSGKTLFTCHLSFRFCSSGQRSLKQLESTV